MLQATTIAGLSAEATFVLRTQTRALSGSRFNRTVSPSANAGALRRSLMRSRYQARSDCGAALSTATFVFVKDEGIGSQVFAALLKPAFFVPVHCMGVRSPSRPFSFGHPARPRGSRTSSFRVGVVVFMPIS